MPYGTINYRGTTRIMHKESPAHHSCSLNAGNTPYSSHGGSKAAADGLSEKLAPTAPSLYGKSDGSSYHCPIVFHYIPNQPLCQQNFYF